MRWMPTQRWLGVSLGLSVLLVAPMTIAQAQQATTASGSTGSTTMTQYADAILAIEPVRQAAANEMKAVMGDRPLPVVICSQADTVKSLSKEAREIAVSFCNQTKGIIEGTGLSIAQFNQITQSHAIDPALKQRIQEELAKLQQKPPQ